VDFKDIAVRDINGVKQLPLQSQLKRIVDNTIGKSVSMSSAVADSGIMISKQPSINVLKKNIAIILENMFHKDDIVKHAGKNMVFNNYSWPDQLLYYKLRNNPRTQQLTATAETTATPPNFAELMGLLPQSGNCIGFPLFVVQLMFYLFEGNAADMTGIDKARLSCALDGNMFKTNAQIIWEQMMKNMKTHEQNFTMTHLLNRLGSTTNEQVYSYVAYFDGDVPSHVPPVGTADILIAAVNSATIPTLKTTNYKTLKRLNTPANQALTAMYNNPQYIVGNPLPAIVRPYNSIGSLAKIAKIFNDVEMRGAACVPLPPPPLQPPLSTWRNELALLGGALYFPQAIPPGRNSRIGWNAAIQTESTMLYVNVNAKLANGSIKNIKLDLTSLKPGDKILITDETLGAATKKRQMWLVEGVPQPNENYKDKVINVPVSFVKLRLTNLRTILPGNNNIPNDAPLTVTLQHFTQENLD
jgi:hypothetical protein